MTRAKWIALVAATTLGWFLSACHRAPNIEQDRRDIQQVLEDYLQSVKTADVTLASEVWLQSPDVVVVTPLGRFQGWDNVRESLYVNFLQKAFTERNLQPSHLTIQVVGNTAWLVFDWAFTAKLANGQPFTSKGWESHVYQRTDRGWRIAHLHYSAPPPPPPQ
jgi:ketosteroid isomerase-like protein